MPALDGVRGAAVAAVLLFHDAPIWNGDRHGRLVGGYLGVDLFFTLSGFLITSLLVTEWVGTGRISLSAFWSRRARRLLPAVIVVLAAMGLYGAWIAPDSQLDALRDDGLAALFYVANWRAIFGGGGYALGGTASPLEHMWSLAVEEQFYVVWPLVVTGVLVVAARRSERRRGNRSRVRPGLGALAAVIVAGTVASSVFMALRHHDVNDVNRVYLGSDARAASILVGAALAVWMAWRGPVLSVAGRLALEVAAAAALAGLVFAWATVEYPTPGLFEGGLLVCALLAAVVIAAAAQPRPGPVARVLALPPLRGLGLISYGLYLWHWPVFVVLDPDRVGFGGARLSLLRYSVALGVSLLSYRFVEQPIRRGRVLHGWSARLAPVVGVAAVVAALVVGTAGDAPASGPGGAAAGAPTDVPDAAPPVTPATPGPSAPSATPTTAAVPGSTGTGRPDPATMPGPAEAAGRYRVMIVGDSVGFSMARGLDVIKDDVAGGAWLWTQAYGGCGLSRGDGEVRLTIPAIPESDGCHDWANRWRADLAHAQPHLVLFEYGGWDIADRKLDGEWVHPCQPGFDAWFAGEVDEALTVLGSQGATVAVTTVPYVREPHQNLFGVAHADVDARVDCLNRIYRAAVDRHAADGAVLVDLAAWVCPGTGPDGGCVREVDGVLLRPDGMHFGTDTNQDAEPIAARWIVDQLVSRGLVPAP
jgi:peptidoglycan/LPS O-acetylase OafA/YrhL